MNPKQTHPEDNGSLEAAIPAVTDGRSRRDDRLRKAWGRVSEEAGRYLVMVLYLWVLFGVFVLCELIVADQRGLSFSAQGFAIVNALILGKVMLVFQDMNLGRWLRRRPLICPIVFESLLLAALFICFHTLEGVIRGLFKGRSVGESIPAIGGGGLIGLAAVALLLFVTLMPFFAFQNLSRALGAGKMNAMLFGSAIKGLEAEVGSDSRS